MCHKSGKISLPQYFLSPHWFFQAQNAPKQDLGRDSAVRLDHTGELTMLPLTLSRLGRRNPLLIFIPSTPLDKLKK